MQGYQVGDPVRVELVVEGTLLVLEGVIVEAIRQGLFRVRITQPKEHEGVMIERLVVKADRFT